MKGRRLNGTSRTARTRSKTRKAGPTRAELAAMREFLEQSPVKPTREGMEAIRRELEGE